MPSWKTCTWIWPEISPAVVNWAKSTRKSSPAKAAWVSANSKPGKVVYHAPPISSSTNTLNPGPGTKAFEASVAPQTDDGCCAAGVVASSAPMVRKLSYANSGKKLKNDGFTPCAFHVVLAGSLYHVPEVDSRINGLSESPEHEDK